TCHRTLVELKKRVVAEKWLNKSSNWRNKMFVRGQKVRHPNQPEWGVGIVVEMNGEDKVRVQFQQGPPRLLNLAFINLELVEASSSSPSLRHNYLEPLQNVDMSKVRTACESFISRMENRRSNRTTPVLPDLS